MSYTKWSQYMVDVCAIVGGMFVVAGIVEALLRNGIGMFNTEEKQTSVGARTD